MGPGPQRRRARASARSPTTPTAENADRRASTSPRASDLLVEHLTGLVDAWAPDADNYRAEFVALDADEALPTIITGIGELSRGELAGERMNVAYAERSQEDEHSCFSDNTTNDLVANAHGHPDGAHRRLSRRRRRARARSTCSPRRTRTLADQLRGEVAASVAAVRGDPAPFDQHLADGVPDDDPGRAAILTAIEALETQTDTIVGRGEAHRRHDQRPRSDRRRMRRLASLAVVAALWRSLSGVRRRRARPPRRRPRRGRPPATSVSRRTRSPLPAPTLTNEERRRFEIGDSFFTKNWVTAPASTDARDGLGPDVQRPGLLVVPRPRRARRTARPGDDARELGLLLRLSVPGETARRRARAATRCTAASCRTEPTRRRPRRGHGRGHVRRQSRGTYGDGTPYELRAPTYPIVDPAFGPLAPTT